MENKIFENLINVIAIIAEPRKESVMWYIRRFITTFGAFGELLHVDYNEIFATLHLSFIPGEIVYVTFYVFIGFSMIYRFYKLIMFVKGLIRNWSEA